VATIEVDEDSTTEPHPASPGDSVVIRLAESPTSGYRWQLDEFDPDVLEPAGDAFTPSTDGTTGGGGTREFRFVVVTHGHSDIALSLRRAWETDTAAARRFRTTVN
jgi:inhibitor of cysteine peptidase